MAEDWLADVRKYVADADETVVSAIVKYLGIALRNRDSSLVSFTDKKETDRVRENFLKKKLGLTDDDATLDAAIAGVGERMKEDRTKNRVTVYYLLAQHFGLLTLFGGAAGAVGAAGTAAALAAVGGSDTDTGKDDDASAAVPLAAAGLAGASAASAAPAAAAPVTPAAPPPSAAAPQSAYSSGDSEKGGGMGWLPWLLLALVLAALLFFGLRYCSKQDAAVAPATDETAISETVAPAEGAAGTAPAAAIPEGAGVVAADREGKPMLTVYFDTGKSDVSNDLTTAAASVKTYLDANPAATLAVSGYNDPTGNAAANAELSKNRAQSVKAALEKLGFAADKVVLEKPAETTTTGTDNSAARRVEVTVKG
jgi:outer membrane protein OmpA-like peptidoglycan-associated protein